MSIFVPTSSLPSGAHRTSWFAGADCTGSPSGPQTQPLGHGGAFGELEQQLRRDRQQRRGDGALEDQVDAIEPKTRQDRLAVAAGGDQRPERGEADVDCTVESELIQLGI